MPIEIRQLVIQAKMEEDAAQGGYAADVKKAESEESPFDINDHIDLDSMEKRIINECLDRVKEFLSKESYR